MKVIVESGATKSDWRIDGKRFLLGGMNVSTMQMAGIKAVLGEGLARLGEICCGNVADVFTFQLYVAGVVTDEIRAELTAFIREQVSLCGNVESLSSGRLFLIEIQNDLVGAARAACGHAPGIAAILGTGSNTCFFDGDCTVSQKVMSGGYVLGDDGSASVLGKNFLYDFLKKRVPSDVASDFAAHFDSSYAGIVENVYRSASPSGYLGSLAPWLLGLYDGSSYVKNLVDNNFRDFIERSLLQYDCAHYPVGVVGGFGYAARDIFGPLALAAGISVSGYVREPIEKLVEY